MPKAYDLAVPTDRYEKNGEQKTKWTNVGVILETANGHVMKLDVIPVTVVDQNGERIPFNGWVNMFKPQPRDQRPQQGQTANPQNNVPADGFDSIPF